MNIHSPLPSGLRSGWLLLARAASALLLANMPALGGNTLSSSVSAAVAPPSVQLGAPAIDLRGVDASGTPLQLSHYKGNVILLAISKLGCVVCDVSEAALDALYEAYRPRGLAVVTCLAEGDHGAPATQADLERWMASHKSAHPLMTDASGASDGVAEQSYTDVMGGFPTLAIIDQAFKVQYLERGLDITALADTVKRLLPP